MSKATLVAVCLLGFSSAIILRAAGHQSAGELAAAISLDRASPQPASESADAAVVNSASKADKLAVVHPDVEAKVVAIEPQVAAPAEKKKPEPAPIEIKSWHWNARSNKITRK